MDKRKSNAMLKYTKRRYDGGSELELIRYIEREQTVAQLQRLQQKQRFLEVEDKTLEAKELAASQTPPEVEPPVQTPAINEAPVAEKRIMETLLLGPLEIAVGLVGILTSVLAIVTFARFKNETLLAQSKSVLQDCVRTLKKGFRDTACGPVKAICLAVAP